MANVQACLADGYSSAGTAGKGLGAVVRSGDSDNGGAGLSLRLLLDDREDFFPPFDVPFGLAVVLVKCCPKPFTPGCSGPIDSASSR
jgi:hypothetical protein